MSEAYPIEPVAVEAVHTAHRVIQGAIPHPATVPLLEELRRAEPVCMEGQPPIAWDHARDFYVFDGQGNQWIDFSSGVLITNAGHGRQAMVYAVVDIARKGLLTSYCFPHEMRARLTRELQRVAPRRDDKVMLLSTGSEADELCIKLAREHARRLGKPESVLVTFTNAFHGRTLGSQFAGGIPGLKAWIGYEDRHFVQVPFPDGGVRSRPEEDDFAAFEASLRSQGIAPERVCGVLSETYQGGNSSFAPPAYMQALRRWCDRHQAVLIMDEVQAGFGRTGRFWGFEHYGIVPDLLACGKGISGALPLSAVIGRKDLLDQFPPGSMTSTHSGNPVCCACALASLQIIQEEGLVARAAQLGAVMQAECARIRKRFAEVILAHHGKGLVASLHCARPGRSDPDARLAWEVVIEAVRRGVMLFAPVGFAGASVKMCPPLVITEDALREGLGVIEESFSHVLQRHQTATI